MSKLGFVKSEAHPTRPRGGIRPETGRDEFGSFGIAFPDTVFQTEHGVTIANVPPVYVALWIQVSTLFVISERLAIVAVGEGNRTQVVVSDYAGRKLNRAPKRFFGLLLVIQSQFHGATVGKECCHLGRNCGAFGERL